MNSSLKSQQSDLECVVSGLVMAMKGIVVAVVVFAILLSFMRPDESAHSDVLFNGGSIWAPMRVKCPRHQRFLLKLPRSALAASGKFVPQSWWHACPPSPALG